MPGNFECIGFRVDAAEDLFALAQRVLPLAELIGTAPSGAQAFGWQDESGARLVFDVRGQSVHNAMPSYAAAVGARLGSVQRLNDDTSASDVLDETGEMVTRLAVDLEQRVLIAGSIAQGNAALVGLVGQISVHKDAGAFAASPASLLDDSGADAGPVPAHFAEEGFPWPPRMGSESFISMGLFSAPRDARPIARLNGVVVEADERTNSLTGRRFIRSRVRSTGFEVDVCAPATELPSVPLPGNVLAATVYLVGSLYEWTAEAPPASGLGSRLRGLVRRAD